MPRFAIALALLGIAGFFVSAEILLRPEIFQPAEKPVPEEKMSDTTQRPKPQETEVQIEGTPRAETYFSPSLLRESRVDLYQPRYSLALFQHAPIIAERDSFYLATFSFKIDGKPIGSVSRIIPTYEVSAGRLLSLVRQKLESVIPPEKKDSLFLSDPLSTVMEANFYLNDRKSFPNTIFLIARSERKVLAFQYPTEYHELVKNIIHLFYQ